MGIGVTLLTAMALSMDGMVVGIAYGAKGTRISTIGMGIIFLSTFSVMAVSLLFGKILLGRLLWISPRIWGASLLSGLGIFQITRAWRERNRELSGEEEDRAIPAMTSLTAAPPPWRYSQHIDIGTFRLVIQILREPQAADIDRSGTIGWGESLLLGTALSLDAFAAGVGFALTDGSLAGTPLLSASLMIALAVGVTQTGMITAGQKLTGRIPEEWLKHLGYIAGLFLLGLGLSRLLPSLFCL